ncbi:MarR family winged helix-turn-helix transcriptional regulator [Nocardioides sp. Kera G14]|uniref:MarR family winged helix-turn-helix transcriptional regulator n=1 Tax=Nocardioides sp. Kera G14 TaxID=2884264 RepID=UPI001D0FA723|nr:MarR family transcriptional regulator [Nocardioides sp. Kera G14]UDY22415.1 MarR family transcriptional regulator [Nocardioides sp. Kera G14]
MSGHAHAQESAGDLLMLAARALRRGASAALEEYDVTPAQARALRTIAHAAHDEDGGLRLSALADRLHVVPRSVTEVVDALETRGLVQRESDPTDRRATIVALTDEGRRIHDDIARARTREFDRLVGRLPARDRADLARILGSLVELADSD